MVSLTPALTGQDLQAIIEDLCAVLRDLVSDARHIPRSVAATLVSVIEQLCRHIIALRLGEDSRSMPQTLTIDVASMPRAAGMPLAVLVSLTYNFQNVKTIVAALREHGIDDPFRGDERLLDDFGGLVGFRNDRVHTSTYGDLDRQAAYDTTERLAFRLPRQFPDMEIDMRLLQGDTLMGMRLRERSLAAYEKAEPLCAAQVAANPGSARAHAKMGLALAGQGRLEEALASYDRAVALEPERAVTHLGRAQALAGMGHGEEALAAYDRTLEIDPVLAEAHLRRGRLLAGMGRMHDALASCDRALDIDDEAYRAHLLRGSLLARMGRSEEALAAYERAVSLGRYDEDVHLQRGDLLAKMGRSDEALASYDRAIRLDGAYAKAHCRKARLLASLGRTDDALYFYNRAIESDPRYARALAGKGSVLALMGRAAESAECHKMSHTLDPSRY